MTKKIFAFVATLMLLMLSVVPVFATENNSSPSQYKYVVDLADVLTDEEEKALNDAIVKAYEQNGYDLVILTTKGVDPDYRMSTADDYYDYNDYCGDGALLLSNFQDDGTYVPGNSWISTSGSCINAITDEDIQDLGSFITVDLELGDYYEGFEWFVSETQQIVKDNYVSTRGKKLFIVVASTIIVGLIGAFVYTNKLKRQLISVEEARDANNYLVDGSLNITKARDIYLYSNIVKKEKPKNDSKSSTHTSSSGSSHGGGGF